MAPTTATTADLERVRSIINDGQRFLLALHRSPDGDSVGSSLTMANALQRLGKTAHVSGPDPIPSGLSFIPGASHWRAPQDLQPPYDVYLFLDCADLDRIGEIAQLLTPDDTVVNIDHHGTNTRYGTVNIIDDQAPAAAVMVVQLLDVLGVELDGELATGLYAGLMTDTGSFRYESTTADTLRLAARLVDAGAEPAEIARNVYETRSLAELRLLATALSSLKVDEDGRLAWMRVTAADVEKAGAERADTDGIVNYARSISGVEVGLLFIQEREAVKVSLRSTAWFDVAALAGTFDGGGHARAAGCTLSLPMAEAEEKMLKAVRRAMAAADRPDNGVAGDD